MEIRRNILWMIFIFSLFLLWDAWQKHQGLPSLLGGTPVASSQVATDPSVASTAPTGLDNQTLGSSTNTNMQSPVSVSTNTVSIQSDVLNLRFDLLGGRLIEADLKRHNDLLDTSKSLLLLNPGQNYSADVGLTGGGENKLLFVNNQVPFEVLEQGTRDNGDVFISLQAQHNGLIQVKTYTLSPGSYDVRVSTQIKNVDEQSLHPALYFLITRDKSVPPGDSYFHSTFSGPVVYSDTDKYQKIKFSELEKGTATYASSSKDGWLGFVQHYFATVWVPPQGMERVYSMRRVSDNLFSFSATVDLGNIAPGETKTIESNLWIGPQDQKAMLAVANDLDVVVDYGFLKVIAKPLFILMTWIQGVVQNWGWTIVLLTICIKLVFFPLSAASYRSMAKMKAVAPRLTALREQYADDKMKLNQAMMELYRTEKINPLGGCLPMLVQIPVFISLYWVLLGSVEMRGAPWVLWIHDLSAPDPFFILPAIMMGTMFLQMRLNPKPPDPMQAKVMMFMPLVFGGMMFFFPAGLVLYWVVNNTLSIAQQWVITRNLDKHPKKK